MSTNDFEVLFANLRSKSNDQSASGTPAPSSAFGLPPSNSPPPPSRSNTLADSTNMSSNTAPNSATAQSLLNLLNFGSTTQPSANGTSTNIAPESFSKPETSHSVSASDLVARFMGPPASHSNPEPFHTPKLEDQGGGGSSYGGEASDPSQDALLRLLSKAQPTHSTRTASSEFRRSEEPQATPNLPEKSEHMSGKENKPIFTYQNPFEQLNASRQQTPKSSTPVPKPAQSPIFKGPGDIPQPSIEQPSSISRTLSPTETSTRKILTPRSASARAEKLARENSARSMGTPEPSIKEETPGMKMEELPIRGAADPRVEAAQLRPEEAVEDAPASESPQAAADEWEDAEESPSPDHEPRKVPVYSFPIRPFVSITLELNKPSEVDIRDDGVMEISRLKKDFDQLDRSLAAASTKYIAYALVKNGGMRIIRQEDGSDRQVFKHSHDRVFNVSLCTTAMHAPPSDHQAILGTGVSGTVYYATLSKEANDLFEKNELDTECLSFAPWPAADENTAGGALKTRAKKSSRHPEYFAIGRGKSIHIIWPANSMCSRYGVTDDSRQVDMEKLYQDRNLQIATGKAGKDFAFSEDDTLIVSLDKTGRLRFWDIRELTDETNATSSRVNPIKVDLPLLSLSTASPAEKSWPTSVLFVDKTRPYAKGGALRYVLVGLRQNHTLQLWDIALGKAVQELNFPHENEGDGVCSVNYHPGSAIIVVGHPTRNSLFFIHLSAPRYTLSSSTTQASFVQRVAAKDPEIPKPESTACMSGVREISFASKGQLRSVELLPIHKASGSPKVADEKTGLFELYVVHSKGVTCLTITKEDLGWDANSKVVHGVDAAKEGVVSMKELKLGSIIEETRSKSPPEELAISLTGKGSKKKSKKVPPAAEAEDETVAESTQANATEEVPLSNGLNTQSGPIQSDVHMQRENKKSKKKGTQASDGAASAKPPSRSSSPAKVDLPTTSRAEQPLDLQTSDPTEPSLLKSVEMEEPKSDKVSVGISGDWLNKEIKKIEQGVSKEFRKSLDNLYDNIQQERLVQDSSAVARQEAMLRLVSSSLATNVENSLTKIIGNQMQQLVLPTITNVTSQAVQAQVGDAVAKTLHHMMPRELGTQLPSAINAALSNPQLSRIISESVAHKIAKQTESQLVDLTNKHVIPTFKNLAIGAAEDAVAKVEARMTAQLQTLETDRRKEIARMEKFGQVVQRMSETLQTMSETQISFQNQLMQDRQQLALTTASPSHQASAAPSPLPAPIARPKPIKPKTKEELDQEEITALMSEGKYEEGSIKWLHTSMPQQVALFDNLFVRFTPEYLSTDVSPLVAFSIAVTVGSSLQTNTASRLEWIMAAFNAVDYQDSEIADLSDHAPALLGSVIQKLESLYMTIAEQDVNNPVLRQIPPVAKKARDMRAVFGSISAGRGSAKA